MVYPPFTQLFPATLQACTQEHKPTTTHCDCPQLARMLLRKHDLEAFT